MSSGLIPHVSTTAEFLFVGCYTGANGTGEGIALLRRDRSTGALSHSTVVAHTPSPSYLATHRDLPVLYAVNEEDAGAVSAFAVDDDGALTPLAVRPTGGSYPCHLAVSTTGRHLLAANYGSGSVTVFPLDADGVPGERSDLLDLQGTGPVLDRQEGPHAHMIVPGESASELLVIDLGADLIVGLRLDAVTGRLAAGPPAVRAEPGTGPRHLVRSSDGALLVAGELAANLTWYRPDPADGRLRAGGSVAASGETGHVQPSGIVMGRDGRFVYLANRGVDTVSTFAWDGAQAKLVAEVSTGGQWPRDLVTIGDYLYVANERSHSVNTFKIDPETGVPRPWGEPTRQPSPTALLRWNPTIAAR